VILTTNVLFINIDLSQSSLMFQNLLIAPVTISTLSRVSISKLRLVIRRIDRLIDVTLRMTGIRDAEVPLVRFGRVEIVCRLSPMLLSSFDYLK
jgi:hypothetical protein